MQVAEDPPVRVAILFTKTLSIGALKCSEASFRTVSRSGVPAGCSYVLRLLQNSTLHNLRTRFRTANNYAVNLQCLFRDDSSSNELSLPLTISTRPVSYSGLEESPLPSGALNIES